MKYATFLIAVASLLISGCSTKSYTMFGEANSSIKTISNETYTQENDFEWKITKGDRLEIIVANQSSGDSSGGELTQILHTGGRPGGALTRDGTEGFLVPPNGDIRLPLIGHAALLGLTENQAAEKLVTAYRQYLKSPFASVKILNQKLFVLGEVKKPGVVQVTNGTMTLYEALAFSGDLTDDAERTNLKIIRGGSRTPQVREINLADMSQMTLSSLLLQPNDIIYVQPRGMKAYNVAFREQMPFFQMINTMMLPFVNYTNIKNGGALGVFFGQ